MATLLLLDGHSLAYRAFYALPEDLSTPDGTVTNETYPQTKGFDGGFCVLELPSREAAFQWAAKIAKACRCSQELREFGYDPES